MRRGAGRSAVGDRRAGGLVAGADEARPNVGRRRRPCPSCSSRNHRRRGARDRRSRPTRRRRSARTRAAPPIGANGDADQNPSAIVDSTSKPGNESTWSAPDVCRARATSICSASSSASDGPPSTPPISACVQARQRPGVGDAVRGRDLGGAEVALVRVGRQVAARHAPLRSSARTISESAPSMSSRLAPSPVPIGIIGATRGSYSSGRPIQNSSPSGSASSSWKNVPRLRPSIAAHDLTDEVAVGEGVVAVRDAGLPVGLLHLERVDHRLPRQRLLARSAWRRSSAAPPGG